jgi:hypothetical protein
VLTQTQLTLLSALGAQFTTLPIMRRPVAINVEPANVPEMIADLGAIGPVACLRDPQETPSEFVIVVDYFAMTPATRARILQRLLDTDDFSNHLVIIPFCRAEATVEHWIGQWTLPIPILNKLINLPES